MISAARKFCWFRKLFSPWFSGGKVHSGETTVYMNTEDWSKLLGILKMTKNMYIYRQIQNIHTGHLLHTKIIASSIHFLTKITSWYDVHRSYLHTLHSEAGCESDLWYEGRGFKPLQRPLLFPSARNYPYCLVLVGSRDGCERDLTIKLK